MPGRRSLLIAALGFLRCRPTDVRAFAALDRWLSTWNGVGLIVAGMERQGYDLELLRQDGLGWRASFYVTGRIHSFTDTTGTAFATTPWEAVQQAAWNALAASGR